MENGVTYFHITSLLVIRCGLSLLRVPAAFVHAAW
jgi:hypothetical protein